MSQPFVGEIRMFAGSFAPLNWAFCNGQLMAIDQNQALFALIGTTYGGDGQVTFGLPDLQGRVPIHQGNFQGEPFVIGQESGSETVTLTSPTMPAHTHVLSVSPNPGHVSDPSGARIAADRDFPAFGPSADTGSMTPMQVQTVTALGGSQPHNNMPPYLCVSFIISLFGVFPSRN
ncbi:MAG TPA: tail fiber protein [Usitatibacter sp.]|jgi:microcystin-dependent protein|nr:tail fiber protein [Usitatibacter sp.]